MNMEKRRKCMEVLARSFPSLQNATGIAPWDAKVLEGWACSPAPSHGMLCAAQFLLTVWNPYEEWECGKFDVMDALGCWDSEHHAAFLAWARAPWWA